MARGTEDLFRVCMTLLVPEYVSQTWRDRLLGAAAGAALTLTTLWLTLVSAAMATIILHA